MKHNGFLSYWLSKPFYIRPGDPSIPVFPGSGSPTAIDTEDKITNDQIVNLSKDIAFFGMKRLPLLRYIMDGITVEATVQETFGHLEDSPNPEFVEYTGSTETVQASPITIGNFNRLTAGAVIHWIRIKRNTRVSATPSTSAVAIAGALNLNFGSAGTPLLANGDKGILIPRHVEQGSTIGDFVTFGRIQHDFQTSIVEEPVILTGTEGAQRLRNDQGRFLYELRKSSDAFNRKLQAGLLYMYGLVPTAGTSHPIHASVGIDDWTTVHRFVYNRRISRFDVDDIIERLARENDIEDHPVALLCSMKFKSMVSGWAHSHLQFSERENILFGTHVTRILTGAGFIVDLLPMNFFDKDPILQGRFYILNRRNMKYRPLIDVRDRDIRYYPNKTYDPGNVDLEGGRIFGEFGLDFANKEGWACGEGVVF